MSCIMLAVKKDQKIEIRVSSIELELVNRAAELRSEKRSQFVRQRLLQAATRTIAEAQSLPLRLKD